MVHARADQATDRDDRVCQIEEGVDHLDGLGRDFVTGEFLLNMVGYVGMGAGCEYSLGLRRYPMGLSPHSRVRSSEFISASTVARTEPTSKANVAPARLNSSGTVAVAPIRSAER